MMVEKERGSFIDNQFTSLWHEESTVEDTGRKR